MRRSIGWVVTVLATSGVGLSACAGAEGPVDVLAWGEDQAVNGFTADETDGWAIQFDSWHSVIADVSLQDPQSGDVTGELPGPFVVDWTRHGQPVAVGQLMAPVGRNDVGFALDRATGTMEAVGDVDEDVLARMEAEGLAHWIVGEASDGERTVRFEWGLDQAVGYEQCRNGADDTPGLAVAEGDPATLQITLHVDHLLWDEVGTEEARLSFGPIADADLNDDGLVTTEELAQVSTLEAGRETGGFTLEDMATYLAFATAQGGHLNGGGLCQARSR